MDDPTAMPIYAALIGYAVGVAGSVMSPQRQGVIACCVIGTVVVAGSVIVFGYMMYQMHVAMSGDPSTFPFLTFLLVGVVLLVPFGVIAYLKVPRISRQENHCHTNAVQDVRERTE